MYNDFINTFIYNYVSVSCKKNNNDLEINNKKRPNYHHLSPEFFQVPMYMDSAFILVHPKLHIPSRSWYLNHEQNHVTPLLKTQIHSVALQQP